MNAVFSLYEEYIRMRPVQNIALFFCFIAAFSVMSNFELYAGVQVNALCEEADSIYLEEAVDTNSLLIDDSYLKFNVRQLI